MRFGEIIRTVLIAARNAALGANLRSLPLVSRPRHFVSYASECLFLYNTMLDRRGIPQSNVFDVLPAENVEDIKLGALKTGEAWFWREASYASDIASLCLLCRILQPKVVFEIGTFKGYTAFHFALNTPDDAVIYTLDMPKEPSPTALAVTLSDMEYISAYASFDRYVFEDSDVKNKIVCLYGDSASFDFAPFHGQVDLFFIDGAHSYEYVRADTLNALKCCHPGSVVAWHDFGRMGVNGVSRWLLELSRTHKIYAIPGGSLAFTVIEHE